MPQTAIKAKGRIGMHVDNGPTRDVARTYREALRREKKDLPAYNHCTERLPRAFPDREPWCGSAGRG